MAHTIDFTVYCPWEFTAVIVAFALEMIGAFRSTSPPSAHSLTLSLREETILERKSTIRKWG